MSKLKIGEIRRHKSIFGNGTFDYRIDSFTTDKRMRITIVASCGNWEIGEKYIDPIEGREKDVLISDEIKDTSEKFLSKSGEKIEAKVTKL